MSNALPDNPYTNDQDDREAARMMNNITKTVFAPIYPVMAEQIASIHGITAGTCIDLGSGPAALSISLAKVTDLLIHAVDKSPHSHAIACDNIRKAGLENRITPVRSDVCTLPFESNFADLIISRGSLFSGRTSQGHSTRFTGSSSPGAKPISARGLETRKSKIKFSGRWLKKTINGLKKSGSAAARKTPNGYWTSWTTPMPAIIP